MRLLGINDIVDHWFSAIPNGMRGGQASRVRQAGSRGSCSVVAMRARAASRRCQLDGRGSFCGAPPSCCGPVGRSSAAAPSAPGPGRAKLLLRGCPPAAAGGFGGVVATLLAGTLPSCSDMAQNSCWDLSAAAQSGVPSMASQDAQTIACQCRTAGFIPRAGIEDPKPRLSIHLRDHQLRLVRWSLLCVWAWIQPTSCRRRLSPLACHLCTCSAVRPGLQMLLLPRKGI